LGPFNTELVSNIRRYTPGNFMEIGFLCYA